MFNSIFATAREGMAVQAQRVEAAAQVIASQGASEPSTEPVAQSPGVRIGALPVGTTIEQAVVTLIEAEAAYMANVAVIETATSMFDSLLDAVDHDHDDRD